MPRPTGWSILAEKALEITALALVCAITESPRTSGVPTVLNEPPQPEPEPEPQPGQTDVPAAPSIYQTPMEFLQDGADDRVRIYRGYDGEGDLFAAFYSDGRIRIADGDLRFAGMIQNGHAHLLQIDGRAWSELFIRNTPQGTMQLELRDGPYEGRVFTCETLPA